MSLKKNYVKNPLKCCLVDVFCSNWSPTNEFQKLWATCDLAMSVIWARSTSFEMREFPSDVRIPTMYFAPQSECFANTRVFLPPELQVSSISREFTKEI